MVVFRLYFLKGGSLVPEPNPQDLGTVGEYCSHRMNWLMISRPTYVQQPLCCMARYLVVETHCLARILMSVPLKCRVAPS